MKHCCEQMNENIKSEDGIVYYSDVFNEYGIPYSDGVSIMKMEFCPWCGKRLPQSMREKWFNELEALGYEEPWLNENIPEEYKSDKWWNK